MRIKEFCAFLAAAVFLLTPGLLSGAPRGRGQTVGPDQVLSRMDDAARRVKTISAGLSYTTVTVLVNDRSTQTGELFFKKGKRIEVLVRFLKPDLKVILFKHNRAEIYYPKINQVQEYDLEKHSNMLQQFLLLGFGTPISNLRSSYRVIPMGEQRLGKEDTQLVELTPLEKDVRSQLTHVNLWVSEVSWLPVQQEFFEPSGDYLIASYTSVRVNSRLPASIFKIHTKAGVERVKMN
ncbi:MAG: outer membrane lipoprotein carrier protein LolA [Acidobacteriota bacterium]|nr:outer membrane lipoprotein carrier protein LolA [Acidobacteriota bacterium]